MKKMPLSRFTHRGGGWREVMEDKYNAACPICAAAARADGKADPSREYLTPFAGWRRTSRLVVSQMERRLSEARLRLKHAYERFGMAEDYLSPEVGRVASAQKRAAAKMDPHPRCASCTILMGPGHVEEDARAELCSTCARTRERRASLA